MRTRSSGWTEYTYGLASALRAGWYATAVPSPTDRRQARYPVVYLLATLGDSQATPAESLRAWRIEGGESREVALELR